MGMFLKGKAMFEYEGGMGYAEVCRGHGIGSPEDLDSALWDYSQLAGQTAEMIMHFGTMLEPRLSGGLVLCPTCAKQILYWNRYCPHCGRKVGWKKRK